MSRGSSPARRDERALGGLGLARRAGRVAIGTVAVNEAARSKRMFLVLIARDAGRNARGRLAPEVAEVETLRCGTRRSLGAALGRGPVAVVGVTERGLATRLARALGVEPGSRGKGRGGRIEEPGEGTGATQ